jgi:signal transduction histidine kinase
MSNPKASSNLLQVLFVEDVSVDRMAIKRFAGGEGFPFRFEIAESIESARSILSGDTFDAAVVDYMLGDGTAFDLIPNLGKAPMIVVTNLGDEEIAVRVIKAGAFDYLVKDNQGKYLKTLPLKIGEAIHRRGMEDELASYHQNLEEMVKQRTTELNREIEERKQVALKLRELNETLEQRVSDRTEELQESLETLRRTQAQLVESEKMAALGKLVAGIAHEINTPIGVGVTAASHLETIVTELLENLNGIEPEESARILNRAAEASRIILRNLRRAADLIRNFKQVAVDQTSQQHREFEFGEYVRGVLISLRPKLKKTKHRVTVNCPEPINLKSDPGAISQIITNLIMNSLIHGFDGIEAGEIQIDIKKDKKSVLFRYRDNGVGIKETELRQIFEPFFTTRRREGGSGLGLHVIYNLVTQGLGGTITCSSEEGKGVEFRIQIPL